MSEGRAVESNAFDRSNHGSKDLEFGPLDAKIRIHLHVHCIGGSVLVKIPLSSSARRWYSKNGKEGRVALLAVI